MEYKIEDIIQDVVTKTNTKLDLEFGFYTGKLIEINEIINEVTRGENGSSLFPFVWLVQNIERNYPSDLESKLSYDYDTDLSIFFIVDADKDAKSAEAFKNNIAPRLDSFVENFITQLQKSRYIRRSEEMFGYKKTNLAKVGSEANGKNKMNKQSDAIFLSITDLQVNKNYNC